MASAEVPAAEVPAAAAAEAPAEAAAAAAKANAEAAGMNETFSFSAVLRKIFFDSPSNAAEFTEAKLDKGLYAYIHQEIVNHLLDTDIPSETLAEQKALLAIADKKTENIINESGLKDFELKTKTGLGSTFGQLRADLIGLIPFVGETYNLFSLGFSSASKIKDGKLKLDHIKELISGDDGKKAFEKNINELNDLKNQDAHRDEHTILTNKFKDDVNKDFNKKNLSILQKHKSIRKNLENLSPKQQDEFGEKAQKFRDNHFEGATLKKGLFGHVGGFVDRARKAGRIVGDNININPVGGSRKYLKQSKKRKSRKKTKKRNCRKSRKKTKKRKCTRKTDCKRNYWNCRN